MCYTFYSWYDFSDHIHISPCIGKHLRYIWFNYDYNIVKNVSLSQTYRKVAKFVNDAFLSVVHKTLIDVDFDEYYAKPYSVRWRKSIIKMVMNVSKK